MHTRRPPKPAETSAACAQIAIGTVSAPHVEMTRRQRIGNHSSIRQAERDAKALRRSGLVYVSDSAPGIRRRRIGKAFVYILPSGHRLRRAKTIARIGSLAIPPAYTDIWICLQDNGHLQATGRDARGRKQYRYHARWRTQRDAAKYDRLSAFAKKLPQLRRQVQIDLRLEGMPRRKVLAAVVRLLETSLIRVGNEEYSRSNGSFGLTTLRNRHASVRGAHVTFEFRGKSKKFHSLKIEDARLARIVKRCQELPGQRLFQYRDDEGDLDDLASQDVNEYLREAVGDEFSAKDFRTWAGTLLAAKTLNSMGEAQTAIERKANIVAAVAHVAQKLGNTPSVCRKCYIHPAVLDAYLENRLMLPESVRHAAGRLSAQERALLALLRHNAAGK